MKISEHVGVGKRGAFTLVEVLTVVVLMGILVAIVLPSAGYTDGDKAETAAKKIAADIEYAQSEAVNRQAPITLNFSPTEGKYSLASGGTLLANPVDGNSFIVNLSTDLNAAGVELNSVDFGDGQSVLTFNALGEPVRADGSPISSNARVVVRCGDSVYTVNVAPVTGRVTVTSGS